jgi:thiamine-monophosphate kinase
LIQDIFAPLAKSSEALGLKDDAALIVPTPGCDMVVTSDTLVAGVHFFASDPADLVARKALRVNLSDLAAKGAVPRCYLLNIALPNNTTRSWLKRFAKGLGDDQKTFDCTLIGGDTVKTPGPLTLSITAYGNVPNGQMVRRGSARSGDLLYVSGSIGDGVLGLEVSRDTAKLIKTMSRADKTYFKQRYRLPQPRMELAASLRGFANAAMDISDGLAGDLALMCAASKLTAKVTVSDIPLSRAAGRVLARTPEAITKLISGGDDYEILCAVPPKNAKVFQQAAERAGVPVCRIGAFKAGKAQPQFIGEDGKAIALQNLSYSHF